MGNYALHTVIGRNSRQRKGLEPSRRLSETTGPRSPSAIRIAFWTTEVTKCAAGCKHEALRFTRRAPKARRYRASPGGLHVLPRIIESWFTRYRSLREAVQCPVRKATSVVRHFPNRGRTVTLVRLFRVHLPMSVSPSRRYSTSTRLPRTESHDAVRTSPLIWAFSSL